MGKRRSRRFGSSRLALCALLALVAAVSLLGDSEAVSHEVLQRRAAFVRAVSADTIEVRLGSGRHELVRLIGVRGVTMCECDPAETHPRPTADSFLRRGARLILTGDANQPRRTTNGRLLAYVRSARPGLTDLGRSLVAAGFVRVVNTRFARRARYLRAQRSAQMERKATWSCPPVGRSDLALAVEDRPDPVRLHEPLVFTATLRNDGPDAAAKVTLTALLPAMALYAVTWGEPGRSDAPRACTAEYPSPFLLTSSLPQVRCLARSLAPGLEWIVTVTGVPLARGRLLGTVTSQWRVRSCSSDSDTSDNAVVVETTELPPVELPQLTT